MFHGLFNPPREPPLLTEETAEDRAALIGRLFTLIRKQHEGSAGPGIPAQN